MLALPRILIEFSCASSCSVIYLIVDKLLSLFLSLSLLSLSAEVVEAVGYFVTNYGAEATKVLLYWRVLIEEWRLELARGNEDAVDGVVVVGVERVI